MSDPGSPSTERRTITRRRGLLAVAVLGGAGLVAACSSSSSPDEPTPTPSPTGPMDESAADERMLVTQYDQVIAALPELASALSPLRAQHADHLAALTGETPARQASAAASQIASSGGPVTAKSAVRTLIAAERAAARQRTEACVVATQPGLARTLAFIAASEASHIPALKAVAT